MYNLEIIFVDESGRERSASLHKSVTAWIDQDGHVMQDLLAKDVVPLVRTLGEARKKM